MGHRFEQTPSGVGRRMGGGRLLRVLLVLGLAAGLLPVAAGPAQAAYSATASVDRTASYRGQTHTFTFTISNTSTAGERIASVRITRPSASWTITGCPLLAPNWDPVATADYCTYAPNGNGRELVTGETELFSVSAAVVGGDATEVGPSWSVEVDQTTSFDPANAVGAAPGPGGSLAADIYGIEIVEVVVGQSPTPAIGSACPPSNKKAPAGTNRVLTVCGRVHTDTAFTAASGSSSLGGTFVDSTGGAFQSGSVAPTTSSFVLANYSIVGVTSTATAGLTVVASVGGNGKSSPSTTLTGYTTDTTPPPAPSVPDLTAGSDSGASSTDNITNVTTPTFTGTAEPDATVEMLVGGVVAATTIAAADGSYTATIPGGAAFPNGTASVTARATDPSDNVGPVSGALSMVVDTAAPVLPAITSNPGAAGNSTSLTWAFSGEANARFTCVLSRPGTTALTDNPCSSPRTYNVATNNDGTYTFRVSQQDQAGNTSGGASSSYVLDRQVPGDPTITSAPPDLTSNAAVQWTFTGAEGGGTYECVLVRPNLTEVVDSSCTSPKAINLSSSADGNYTFKVRQRDAAGNFSAYETDTFTLDRQAPPAPAFTAQPPAQTNNPSVAWNFTGESGGSFECVLSAPGGAETTDPNCSGPKSYNLATEADGLYTFKVRQTDNVGNAGPYATSTFTLDRQTPAAPNITVRPANATSSSSPSWTFTGELGASYECVLTQPDGSEISSVPCTSPKSFGLSASPDGDYTFKVRQIDPAGNVGPYAVDDFALDRSTPSAPNIIVAPLPQSSDATPTWEFSGEAGAVYECVLERPDSSQVTDAACSSPKSYDLSTRGDGLYTFRVRQTDPANNTSSYATSSFNLDRQAPAAPTITGRPANATNDEDPEWSFAGEFGASFECILVRPDASETTVNPCGSPSTFNLAAEADGAYTFKVRQFDAAGNPGPYASDDSTLDRIAPATPTFDDRPADRVADPVVGWTFSGEAGGHFECVLVRPDLSEVADPTCVSRKTIDLSDDDDGTYTFKVRQVDDAGQPSAYATDTFGLDRQAPTAPAITIAPPPQTNDPMPSWSFTGEGGGSFECTLLRPNGAVVSDLNCGSPKSYDLTLAEDGVYTFSVRQHDDTGNAGPYATSTITLDRQAPSAPLIGTRPANATNDPDPVWTFSGESNAAYECVLVRPNNTQTAIPCTSPTNFNLGSESDGGYTFRVRQIDQAGNPGPYAADDFVLDRVAPDPPAITSRPSTFTNDDTPTWAFVGDGSPPFECIVVRPDNTEVFVQPCSSPYTTNLTLDEDGTYTFRVRQLDDAGNRSLYTNDSFTLDRETPALPTITAQPPESTNDATPEWSFSGEFAAVFDCVLVRPNGTDINVPSCSSPRAFDLSGEADGLYTFKVRQTDRATNTSAYATDTFTLDRQAPVAPAITDRPANVTPDQDPDWRFTGEAGATFECVLVRPDGSQSNRSPCTSPATFVLNGDEDGDYVFRVRQIDAAGNPGEWESDAITLDRVPPGAPTILSRPDGEVRNPVVGWTFAGEPNAMFECVLVRPDSSELLYSPCSSPRSVDLSTESDGDYTFKVRQIDEAGHPSPYETDTFALDRIAPASPTITVRPPEYSNDPLADWAFTGEGGGTYDCIVVRPDGSEVGPAACLSPAMFNLTKQPDGNYTFKVRQTDDAGNVGPYAIDDFVLDRDVPRQPAFTALPPNTTGSNSPRWGFTGEGAAMFECFLVRSDRTEKVASPCVSPHIFSMAGEADGSYTVKVRQVDLAGNRSGFATDAFTLDRTAPNALMITSEPPAFSSGTTPEWLFEGESGGSYECFLSKPNGGEAFTSNCTSPKSYNLSGGADGLYAFKVRQIDSAFNRSEFVTSSFTLDRAVPDAPTITDRPSDPTNVDPRWAFTGEANAAFECMVVRPNGSQTAAGPCESPATVDFSEELDGRYTFKVRQLDGAGNVSAQTVDSFTIDRQAPPIPTITDAPPADTKDPDATWEFDGGEDGGTFECVFVDTDGVENTIQSCSGPQSHDLSDAPDGTYTFKVRHTDEAGNASNYAISTTTLDRLAPEPPAITSTPQYFYDVTPTWEFSGEPGGTYGCVLQRPDATEIIRAGCSSPVTFDLSDQTDGTYTFKVRQMDAADNASAYSSTVHLFNATPPTPVLGEGPPVLTNDATHQTTIEGEPDAVFECALVFPNGTRSVQMGCASPYEIDLTDDPDGDYTLKVRQWIGDNPSLAATQDFTLDRVAAKPAVSVAPGPTSNSPSPTWSFEGEEGARFECVFVPLVGTEDAEADCSGPVHRSLEGQPDGAYTLKVRQTDPAGNMSAFAARSYELDTTAPSAPTFRSTPPRRTRDLTPTWAFDGEGGATFACKLTAPNGVVRSDEDCTDRKTFNLNRVLGKYRLVVTQTDRAGNEGPPTVGVMILDRIKPVAKRLRVSPKRFRPARTTKVSIRFHRSERASATVLIKRGTQTLRTFKKPLGRTMLSFEWRTVHRTKVVAPGRYKVLVKLKDEAGNESKAAVPLDALP